MKGRRLHCLASWSTYFFYCSLWIRAWMLISLFSISSQWLQFWRMWTSNRMLFRLKKKMNLSSFRGLAIRQNSSSWARVSNLPPPTVVIRDTKKVIEKATDTDFYEKKKVLSTCFIERCATTSNVTFTKVVPKNIMKPDMKLMKKSSVETFTKPVTPHLPAISAWIYYTTS